MGQPAAKLGDQVEAQDMHLVILPPGSVPPTVQRPFPFKGIIDGGCSSDVKIMNKPAAVVGSTASNKPPHLPPAPPESFQIPPTNMATIMKGSATVMINGKPAVRAGDTATTCNDMLLANTGVVVVTGATVNIG